MLRLVPGTKVKFKSERLRYTVQASNERFAVCTKPFNPRRTVLYTVIDLRERVRGTENLVFGMGAETREQCIDMLERLASGKSAVSHRNRVALDIEHVETVNVASA